MLSRRLPPPHTQQGMVLLMAIVALVALTLGALALTRSVYTSNVIAGNLAFQRSATHSAEAGLEAAIEWLQSQNGKISAKGGQVLHHADKTESPGYSPNRLADERGISSWVAYWNDHLKPIGPVALNAQQSATEKTGNTVSWAIERMCTQPGDPTATSNACTVSPRPSAGTCSGGSSCSGGEANLDSPPSVYYRITVLVEGPRQARSLVQTMVAL